MRLAIATYTYKDDAKHEPRLGFIIEDAAPSEFIEESRDRVDLYAYTSAVIAALKVQQKQIADLEAEVRELRKTVSRSRSEGIRKGAPAR